MVRTSTLGRLGEYDDNSRNNSDDIATTSNSRSGSNNNIAITIESPKQEGLFDSSAGMKAAIVGVGVLSLLGIGFALLSD